MSLDISPKDFVDSLICSDEGNWGNYRILRECNCQAYRDAVVAEAELRGLSEHPVLVRLVENF